MDKIHSGIVEKTWKRVGGMNPSELNKLIILMRKKQPSVLAYLMAVEHDLLNQDERELILYLGVLVWQIMSQGNKPLPKITEDTLFEMDDSNKKMLEYLMDQSETGFNEVVETMSKNYNQQNVLKYVIEALFEEPEEDCNIREENMGIIFISLKTIIDCFNK